MKYRLHIVIGETLIINKPFDSVAEAAVFAMKWCSEAHIEGKVITVDVESILIMKVAE